MTNKSKHTLYRTHHSMIQRCYNSKNSNYENYGARGITVCKLWLRPKTGFQNFLNSMGEKPSALHTLDRINNNGNYTPKNCKWSTSSEQNNNRRPLKLNGKSLSEIRQYLKIPSMTAIQIAKSYNISQSTVAHIKSGKIHSNKY